VIAFVPTGRAVDVVLAVPLLRSVAVPNELVPLKNCTVPVGVPEPGLTAITVAVSVTDAPEPEGLGTATTELVVLAFATVTGTPGDVLPA
jgi:hypothetical protein